MHLLSRFFSQLGVPPKVATILIALAVFLPLTSPFWLKPFIGGQAKEEVSPTPLSSPTEKPTLTPEPTDEIKPTRKPTITPIRTTPKPTSTPKPTDQPQATSTPTPTTGPTSTPGPTATPSPTTAPTATPQP